MVNSYFKKEISHLAIGSTESIRIKIAKQSRLHLNLLFYITVHIRCYFCTNTFCISAKPVSRLQLVSLQGNSRAIQVFSKSVINLSYSEKIKPDLSRSCSNCFDWSVPLPCIFWIRTKYRKRSKCELDCEKISQVMRIIFHFTCKHHSRSIKWMSIDLQELFPLINEWMVNKSCYSDNN